MRKCHAVCRSVIAFWAKVCCARHGRRRKSGGFMVTAEELRRVGVDMRRLYV